MEAEYPILLLHDEDSHDTHFSKVVTICQMHETHVQTVQAVRELVTRTLRALGSRSMATPRETLLIRNGNYFGRRFDLDDLRAVWFIEENQLKFYGRDGHVIKSLQPFLSQDQEPSKAA